MSVEEVVALLGIEATSTSPRRLWARCPSGNHDEGHGFRWSIMISGENLGMHYCQACKFGGSLADLVMHVRDVSYQGARAWLEEVGAGQAERLPVASVRVEITDPTLEGFRIPPEVFFEPLERWPSQPRAYALSRGLDARVVERWGIGCAVDGRLAGRVVLVTRDERGRPANYAARTYTNHPKRYLAASGWERPDHSVLFGEQHWPAPIERSSTVVVVVEGAINGIAVDSVLTSERFDVAVAGLSGSRVSPVVVAKLMAFRAAIVLTDPDRAGDEAAEEVVASLVRHVHVARVRLPEGQDAASVERSLLGELLEAEIAGCW